MPWEDEPAPHVGCAGNNNTCRAGKAKESIYCVGHTRAAVSALIKLAH